MSESAVTLTTPRELVREPLVTGRTSAPIIFMLKTFSFCRRMSSSPM